MCSSTIRPLWCSHVVHRIMSSNVSSTSVTKCRLFVFTNCHVIHVIHLVVSWIVFHPSVSHFFILSNFHPFIKCFTHLYPLYHHLYDVHSMFSWCDWFSMFAVSIAQIFLLVLLKHQAQLEKYLKLIVSCPDGKPSEEAPKGRGRGFGGMKWIQRDIECTNSVAVCAQ